MAKPNTDREAVHTGQHPRADSRVGKGEERVRGAEQKQILFPLHPGCLIYFSYALCAGQLSQTLPFFRIQRAMTVKRKHKIETPLLSPLPRGSASGAVCRPCVTLRSHRKLTHPQNQRPPRTFFWPLVKLRKLPAGSPSPGLSEDILEARVIPARSACDRCCRLPRGRVPDGALEGAE